MSFLTTRVQFSATASLRVNAHVCIPPDLLAADSAHSAYVFAQLPTDNITTKMQGRILEGEMVTSSASACPDRIRYMLSAGSSR